jgi:hypothetical protein
MSVTRNDPGTIFLSGPRTVDSTYAAAVAITPGMLVEKFNTAGVWRLKPHTLTSKEGTQYALEQSMLNKAVSDVYAIGDLVETVIGAPGTEIWALIASGQNIVFGNALESAGDGTLKVYSSGIKIATALETKANVTVATRLRIEVI